ncbi:MAG TPA: FMN-binding negative transcriptional regulator [Polyangia bacterium]|nr:FMN-binding negative transcriptional regulator [Polyangia bacterium]
MYVPPAFAEIDPEKLIDLCRRHPFATLVTPAAGELHVSHVPLLVRRRDDAIVIAGHLARENAHARALAESAATTAIFQGPHGYISPSWYTTSPAVPTWNYVVVHASGPVAIHDDVGFVAELVRELTARFEPPGGWSPDSLPDDFNHMVLGAIIGFELQAARLEGKLKLSQNRSAEDRAGVIAHLEADGTDLSRALAGLMRGAP